VFYEGQLWDACSLEEKLIGRAKKTILLIDSWVGPGTLDMLAKKRKRGNFRRGNEVSSLAVCGEKMIYSQQNMRRFRVGKDSYGYSNLFRTVISHSLSQFPCFPWFKAFVVVAAHFSPVRPRVEGIVL
jgi:hypothetical protein